MDSVLPLFLFWCQSNMHICKISKRSMRINLFLSGVLQKHIEKSQDQNHTQNNAKTFVNALAPIFVSFLEKCTDENDGRTAALFLEDWAVLLSVRTFLSNPGKPSLPIKNFMWFLITCQLLRFNNTRCG